MPDNNLAIFLAIFLSILLIAFASWQARKWFQSFIQAMVQSKTADQEHDV